MEKRERQEKVYESMSAIWWTDMHQSEMLNVSLELIICMPNVIFLSLMHLILTRTRISPSIVGFDLL